MVWVSGADGKQAESRRRRHVADNKGIDGRRIGRRFAPRATEGEGFLKSTTVLFTVLQVVDGGEFCAVPTPSQRLN
jgi:hypothetical protein